MSRLPRPQDFFSDEPPERIIGTERECNIQLIARGNEYVTNQYDYVRSEAIKKAGYKHVDGFLDTGPHVYIDVGHIEINTQEELGPTFGAAGDAAGMIVVSQLVEASGVPHNGIHGYTGLKTNGVEKTSGRHENYLFPRCIERSGHFDTIMASHLTSRVYSWAGILRERFELSQKVKGIGDPPITRLVERRTAHGKKPMAMIPPAADDSDTMGGKEWARLEVRNADAGFSLTGNYLTFAATSLVLRLIEHKKMANMRKLTEASFRQSAATATTFNKSLTFRATAETQDGRRITAVDYQEMLIGEVEELAKRIHLPEDEARAIELWKLVCTELRSSDIPKGEYGRLMQLVDFAPLHYYMRSKFRAGDLKSSNKEVLAHYLMWYRILPEGGALKYWDKVGSPFVSKEDVEDCLTSTAPTRARARGKLIKASSGREGSHATWSGATNEQGRWVPLHHPYDTGQ